MRLSIIIPAYNVSPYIPRCLDNLLAQGLKDGEYEILLIDDGSTDNSLEVCKRYAQQYPTIFRVISKSNEGVSATRNRGIREAQGEYIYFIDPDDYLMPGGLQRVMETYLDSSVDVLQFGYVSLREGASDHDTEETSAIVYDGHVLEAAEGWKLNFVPWNSIIKKSWLLDAEVTFSPRLHIMEDLLFNLELALKNPHIRIISDKLYRYILRKGSATQDRKPAYWRTTMPCYKLIFSKMASAMEEHASNKPFTHEVREVLTYLFFPFLVRHMSAALSMGEYRELRRETEPYLALASPTKIVRTTRLLYRMPAWLYPPLAPIFRHGYALLSRIYRHVYTPMRLKLSRRKHPQA